ncbi:MAG: hypothetical protein ABR907_09045 [Terracidiphilus sp.]|jgi:SMC interacting uncharacterized protein involved in chromosome segregation
MTDGSLHVMKQETERLNLEIEALQEKIRLHNENKDAWTTIVRNAKGDSQAAYLDIAHSEAAKIDQEIEAVQEQIRLHIQTRDAWDMVTLSAGSHARVDPGIMYTRGEDVQWHLQKLDTEIEALQGEIRLHNEIKSAWDTIMRDTGSQTLAANLELANSETARLNKEIEAVQVKIRHHLETRGAWDTIMRNAVSESHVYQGATYVKGLDGQWHLQETPAAVEFREPEDRKRTDTAASKVTSVRQALINACETLRSPQKHINIPVQPKEQFQSLGLTS